MLRRSVHPNPSLSDTLYQRFAASFPANFDSSQAGVIDSLFDNPFDNINLGSSAKGSLYGEWAANTRLAAVNPEIRSPITVHHLLIITEKLCEKMKIHHASSKTCTILLSPTNVVFGH